MKKIKKVLAVLLTLAMVMAMSITTYAAVPTENDKTTATVQGVISGATVKAYQITKAMYNTDGFYGYEVVNESYAIANVLAPTAEEVKNIALTFGTSTSATTMTESTVNENVIYTADLAPGYWIILVSGTVEVYNPMLLGVYYSVSGSDNSMTANPVTADSNWKVDSTDAYAKSSGITIDKVADDETEDIGDDVNFTVTTTVPDYSNLYNNNETDEITYYVSDTMEGLTLKLDADSNHNITVSVSNNKTEIGSGDYVIEVNEAKTSFSVDFADNWIEENPGATITITYTAIMTGDAVNKDPHTNTATLTYTNAPGETKNASSVEKVYTFDIDGEVTGDILKKVGNDGNTALSGAEFTLYTDENCTIQYTNSRHTSGSATITSDANGKMYIFGLAEGTYYLKETKAPSQYTLNNTVYTITVNATVDEKEELTTWVITVSDGTNTGTYTYNVNNGTVNKSDDYSATTLIQNTSIANLPSTGGMGTTLFTIGGCIIMILAAALFFVNRRRSAE